MHAGTTHPAAAGHLTGGRGV
ncbi:MAG: hypothetical protein JWO38_2679, partial [Gemmataceae bacterium]|nr:hypothetical protein [Gemmataceae bacterium]